MRVEIEDLKLSEVEESEEEQIERELNEFLKELFKDSEYKLVYKRGVEVASFKDNFDPHVGTTAPVDKNAEERISKEIKEKLQLAIKERYILKWRYVADARLNYWIKNNAVKNNQKIEEKRKYFREYFENIRQYFDKILKNVEPQKLFPIRDKIRKGLGTYGNIRFKNELQWYRYNLYLALNETLRLQAVNYAKTHNLDMDPYLKRDLGTTGSILSWLPAVGEGYDVLTLIRGKDPLTGEKLQNYEKVFVFIGLASGVGSGKAAKDLVNAGLEKIAKELGVSLDEVIKIAKEVAGEYKVDSLGDLIKLKDKLNLDDFLGKVRGKVENLKILKNKLKNVKLSNKVLQHMEEDGRFVPISILKEVILKGKFILDPKKTSNAKMFYSRVNINGKNFNLEVLYDEKTNMIFHFLYSRKAIGDLPKIIK